jgi:hypothetical protein
MKRIRKCIITLMIAFIWLSLPFLVVEAQEDGCNDGNSTITFAGLADTDDGLNEFQASRVFSDTDKIDWAGVNLLISGTHFTAGDQFTLRAVCYSGSEQTFSNLYVALDVFGQFFFYPDWKQTPDCREIQCGGSNL